eukprot:XP_016656147.1 PREDICTED: uncharacterized protein LOC100160969 isoform X2 [Acyrthosiphon pisum]
MPTVCAVYGCTNKTTNKSVSFFRFPKKKKSAATDLQKLQEDQRNMWLKSLHRVDLKNKQVDAMRICSSHFKSGKPACYTNNKHPDWCPSINMGYKTNKGAATTPDIKRYHRATKQMALTPTILFPNDLENDTVVQSSAVVAVPNSNDGENMDVSKETGTSTSTTITMADIQTLEQEDTSTTTITIYNTIRTCTNEWKTWIYNKSTIYNRKIWSSPVRRYISYRLFCIIFF